MKKFLLLLMAVVISLSVTAQILVCDTVVVDDDDFVINVTQHPMESYKYIDTCTARYSIVYDYYGRCGIYNNFEKKNITELEYRELDFSCTKKMENGDTAFLFSAKKGTKKGIVSVGASDNVVSVMMDDEDLIYSLDKCTTIDKNIAKETRKILLKSLRNKANMGATHGQILVMDSKSGQIKAWVALEKNTNNEIIEAPLRKHQCSSMPGKILISSMAMPQANLSWEDVFDTKNGIDTIGGLMIKDININECRSQTISYKEGFKSHSDIAMANVLHKAISDEFSERWNLFTDSPREIDALTIATMYNYIASNGKTIEPSVDSDSVVVFENKSIDAKSIEMTRDLLKNMLQNGGKGSVWTTQKVDLSGDYCIHKNCRPTVYDENIADIERYYSDKELKTYNQIIFAGYLPSDVPRYTICITMNTKTAVVNERNISYIVNKLAGYLDKR